MKIHPLQTGTVRVKQFQLTGASNIVSRLYQLLMTDKWSEWLPIYSWLIELDDTLILIDTGETHSIYDTGYLPDGGTYHKAVETKITREEEIDHQLKSLGFHTDDIDTVVLTHLHGDHIGGIKYFPHSTFYVSKTEYELATSKKGAKSGYFTKNWPSWFVPTLVTYEDGPNGAFDRCQKLDDLPITIVPTPGHSAGHQSVILHDHHQDYFIGGDLTYNLGTLESKIPNTIFNNKEAKDSIRKAKEYVHANQAIYLSSHDWHVPQILSDSVTI